MTQPRTQVSGVEAVRAWINSIPGLTGGGCPLPLGARSDWVAPRSPGQGAYALLAHAGGGPDPADGVFMSVPRVSASVYAGTMAAAAAGAVALLEAIAQYQYQPPRIVTLDLDRGGGQVRVEAIDSVTGPTAIPDGYLVDALYTLTPIS